MATYKEITEARNILELPETATRETIRAHYRRLLARWHPDKGRADQGTCHDMTVRIVEAYRILVDYCKNYQYSFAEETVRQHMSPEEWWADRFGQDPLWGRGDA